MLIPAPPLRKRNEVAEDKDEIIDGMKEGLQAASSRIDVGGDAAYQQCVNQIKVVADRDFKESLGMLSLAQLTRLHGLVDNTNPDMKMTDFKKVLFHGELAILKQKRATADGLDTLMFDVCSFILTRDFSDDYGKICWKSSLKKAISSRRDELIRLAAAPPAPAAPAAGAAPPAADVHMG
eukprot:1840666-Karenia_brevis.AAC.1